MKVVARHRRRCEGRHGRLIATEEIKMEKKVDGLLDVFGDLDMSNELAIEGGKQTSLSELEA
jgi:hypothetical protein